MSGCECKPDAKRKRDSAQPQEMAQPSTTMKRRDFAAGLVLAGAGVLVAQQVQTLSYRDEFGPGPGFLPLWLGLLMIVLASGLAISALRTPAEEQAAGPRTGRALLAWSGIVAMVAAMETIGFIASLGLLSFFLVYVIERRSFLGAITVAATITLSFFLLFRVILPAPLP